MQRKLINICGTGRSGSTMVDLMLGNDQRAFSLGEVYAWFRPFRTHHFKIICSCGKKNCPWEQIRTLKEDVFHRKCFEILDVDILVDSSKNLSWIIDNNLWAEKNDIKVYNVLLFKDPVSFFYSSWKRGVPIKKAKRIFKKYYNRFYQTNLPFIALDYNKLIANPATMLEKLCCSLEIPYFSGKVHFWEKEHHHLFGSRGTRDQVEASISQIKRQEEYPKEFKNIIPLIEAGIAKDAGLQNILARLKANAVNDKKKELLKNKMHKPYWYYLSKATEQLRKRFPAEVHYDQ